MHNLSDHIFTNVSGNCIMLNGKKVEEDKENCYIKEQRINYTEVKNISRSHPADLQLMKALNSEDKRKLHLWLAFLFSK